MDTDVGDLQNGLLDVQEAMRQTLVSLKQKQKKIEHSTTTSSIWYLYNYSSSYFEIPVKPGVPDTTSIRLYPNSSVAHPSASATRLYLDVYEGCRYVDEISMTWICKRESKRETRERERGGGGCLTLRQGLSVCAPTMENPLPGLYFPPTAKAITVEKLLTTKYYM